MGEIERLGRVGLHAVGEFKGVDARGEIGLRGAELGMLLVHLLDEIERGALLRGALHGGA